MKRDAMWRDYLIYAGIVLVLGVIALAVLYTYA
jgi:hypothetical protein